jgi:hypothetical protein
MDEVHASEPYTLRRLQEAPRRERPARMAMASATLSNGLLSFLPAGELIEAEESLWRRQRYRLELCEGMLLDSGIGVTPQSARQGKTVVIVSNAVRHAQSFADNCEKSFAGQIATSFTHASPFVTVSLRQAWSEGSRRIYRREMLDWSVEILSDSPAVPTDGDLVQGAQPLYERVVETEEWQKELQEGQKTLITFRGL